MYGEIVFYTHGSTIEYGGEIFPTGELTADILNFAPEDYPPIQRLLDRMKELSKRYSFSEKKFQGFFIVSCLQGTKLHKNEMSRKWCCTGAGGQTACLAASSSARNVDVPRFFSFSRSGSK